MIEGGQAKYMFVFQGSLARPELLAAPCSLAFGHSTSVYSPVISSSPFGLARRHAYDYIYKCLGMNSAIARHSHITSAVRMGKLDGTQDRQQNRRLLQREIEQINPELVVLVGSHASATVGDKIQREHRSLYFNQTPFPTKGRSIADVEKENRKYDELQGRWPVR